MSTIYRQGDVMLERISDQDVGEEIARDAGRIVLAYGEVTGHAHAIHDEGATLFRAKEAANADTFLRVVRPVALTHEEHSRIPLVPGLYRVRRQREWTDENEPIQVAD
jgi:hypothetical protein